jgi:hypothetical protein
LKGDRTVENNTQSNQGDDRKMLMHMLCSIEIDSLVICCTLAKVQPSDITSKPYSDFVVMHSNSHCESDFEFCGPSRNVAILTVKRVMNFARLSGLQTLRLAAVGRSPQAIFQLPPICIT